MRRMWELFQQRDWDPVLELLADDLVVVWPATRERMRGPANFLEVQRNYPEPWGDVSILEILATGNKVASEVRIDAPGVTFFVLSFFDLRDGRIARATEYWLTAGTDTPPPGRERWVERY